MKRKIELTPAITARMFGCSIEQARAQYRKNAAQLREMAAEAAKLPAGKKYRGSTAAEWLASAERFERIAEL
jgi:IS5 family transposase